MDDATFDDGYCLAKYCRNNCDVIFDKHHEPIIKGSKTSKINKFSS
jgi:hypothetical protein